MAEKYMGYTWVISPQKKWSYMGVSKNRGTSKWMIYDGKPYENR